MNTMCLREFRIFSVKTDRAILNAGLEEGSYLLILFIKIKNDHRSNEVIFLM